MLKNFHEELYGKYFLTKEMSDIFNSDSDVPPPDTKLKILALRKLLIISAEKEFVESLGIKYN